MWAVKVDKNTPMDQTSFEADQDDTVAVSVTNGTRWNNTNVAVSKLGRSTNVYNAEAWGFNSAVHIVGQPLSPGVVKDVWGGVLKQAI